ncbi:MAG: GH32 C-terminal domain-containing protein [Bacteroidaceae bacterium]|nr:GH32 C-terminal domain-containing protein [Bacteroidaceae bacterium]
MKTKKILLSVGMSVMVSAMNAQTAAHFDMSLGSDGRSITESVSSSAYTVQSQLPAFNVKSPDGVALRFDGYSNFVKASLPVSSFSTSALTIRVVLAAETYPMMNTAEAENTPTYSTICGNLNESAKQGFAFQMSSQGDLRFQFGSAYADGYLFTIDGSEKLKCGQWNVLTVVLDKAGNKGTLYLNGNAIGTCRMSRSDVQHSASDFWIGKDATELKTGPFLINTFCGLMDDIAVYNSALTADEVAALANNTLASSVAPDFNYPSSRYAESLWRPQFHGMPSGGWTNECHGMTYSDGRYHVFFQKNANGPYMARLHWGHISSENLYSWTEEPIAIAPGESYDIKGCWSGCVFTDAQLTGGKPNIIYTAVDNAKAVMAQASPADETLADWNKQGVIINGRPSGLSDDFRDPYFFAANGQKYIIVGTSKNGVGACTLHQYQNGSWTNDGSIFFQGTNANQHGTFWEMPNMTDMGNGKWLFTCTPLNTGAGVRTLCWVGSVGLDGKFVPDNAAPQFLEMNGISKDGYGLLSPTIYQKDGKTLLLGIVPDKLAGSVNAEMGWAHNYSLPREISLASDGSLVQKPYSGLTGMRTETKVERTLQLNGTESLAPVSGRQVELLGEFTVGGGEMGFRFLKKGDKGASLTYNSDNGMLTLDLTALDRTANDNGVYNGVYAVALPEKVAVGQVLKLHVFLDGSIADIFVNDTWAFSVRLFPTNAEQTEAEVFATNNTTAKVSAWLLDAQQKQSDAIETIWNDSRSQKNPSIYNLQGIRLSGVPAKGMCIINGKKYYAR